MKSNLIKGLAGVMAAAMVVTALPATPVEAAGKVKATTIKVSATKATITAGKTKTIKVTLNKKNTKAVKVTLKSSKASVAKVPASVTVKKGAKTASFKITAKKAGSATITASFKNAKGKTAKATVKTTVKAAEVAEVAATKATLNTTTPAVGTEMSVTVEPTGAKVTSYSWLLDGTEAASTATYKIPEGSEGKTVQVVVTDSLGNQVESDKVVISQAAAKLIDASGLQADGTGLINDELKVTYTADLGNPSQVTWYRDGTAIKTQTAQAANGLTFTYSNTGDAGNYYATITTGEGKNFTSNSIYLAADEVRATIGTPTITNYTDESGFQTFDSKDKKAVVTVEINKKYDGGVLYLFNGSASTYAVADAAEYWVLDGTSDDGTYKGSKGNQASPTTGTEAIYAPVTTMSRLTDKAAIQDGDGLYYKAEDGKVTYKLVTEVTGVTRGSDYKLVYNQGGIKDDDPTATNKNVNVTAAATAPYLPAPAAIAVTSLTSDGSTTITAKATVYSDEAMTTPVAYFGDKATPVTATNSENGLTMKAYTATGAKAENGSEMSNTTSVALVGGESDEFTQTYAGTITGAYATMKTAAGIFAKNAATITSAFRSLPANAATKVSTSYDKKKPNEIKVTIDGNKTSGTVYVIRTQKGSTDYTETNITEDLSAFKKSDSSTYIGSAEVAKNTSEVSVESVVDQIYSTGSKKADAYSAVYVPNNEEDFASVATVVDAPTTNTKSKNDTYCVVEPMATVYTVTGSTTGQTIDVDNTTPAAVATEMAIKDQFGNDFTLTADIAGGNAASGKMTLSGPASGASADKGIYCGIKIDNKIYFHGTGSATQPAVGDSYTYKIEDGYFLKAKFTGDDTATISISSSAD